MTTNRSSDLRVGSYQLTNRLGAGDLGEIFLAKDAGGRHAIVARLTEKALPEDRKRFAELVRIVATGEEDGVGVLAAEPKADRPWVATALGNPTGADQLVRDFDPTIKLAAPVPMSEADLVPPDPFAGIATDKPASRPVLPLMIIIGLVVVLCLAGGAFGAVLLTQSGSGDPSTDPSDARWGAPMDHPMPSGTPSATPSQPAPSVSPAPEPPTKGGWPASWKKFTSADKTRTISLRGVPFSFRVPDSWGCLLLSSDATTTVVSCIDDQFQGDQRPRVRLTFRACPSGCAAAQQRQQRADIETFGQRWIAPDSQSTFAEAKNVTTSIGTGRYVLAVSRFFHSKQGGPLDRQLVMTASGGADRAGQDQQIVNDVRVRVS
ncbi:hypothetical protein [Fodinicola acaciae]|uniref:hypothetical protein n=1 Tax=Fodinicola acaciae TaxID=2681555 RepID=UPI0013CFAF13|nr:hypothetical protein [Fodinicola acaciae]